MTESNQSQPNISLSQRQGWSRFLPFLEWIGDYRRADLAGDGLAGLMVAILMVPQAMAYALLADLPPQVGLYTAIGPALVYAMFGASRFVVLGPTALISLLAGDTAARAAAAHDISPPEAALALAALVGLILALMGLLRLGFIVNFISEPVLTGFTSAAAVLIAASQLPNLLGLEVPRGSFYETMVSLGQHLTEINPVTAALGSGILLALLAVDYLADPVLDKLEISGTRRLFVTKGTPFLLVVLSIALVWSLALHQQAGVAVVGELGGGLPPLTRPPLGRELWLSLLPGALIISAVTYVLAMAVAKSLAGRCRQNIKPDQEAIAVGLANLATALTGGYPAGASLSRSALNFEAGARTPASTAVSAGLVLLIILLFSAPVQFLPKAMLAALVISAVFSLFDLKAMRQAWRYSRMEAAALFITFFSILILGLEQGIALGALAGIVLYLWRTSQPRVVVEGRVDEGRAFRSTKRDDVDHETLPVLVLRIDQSLYFANINYCEKRALEEVAAQKDIRHLLLDLKSVNDIDLSGFKMLDRLALNLAEAGVSVNLAAVKEPLMERLKQNGFLDIIDEDHLFLTADEAVEVLKSR